MSTSKKLSASLMGLVLFPLSAAAQSPPASPAAVGTPVLAPAASPVATSAADIGPYGYTFRSAEGGLGLKINTLLQLDGRFFLKDQRPELVDTFYLRRAIPFIQGSLGSNVSFLIAPDFGQGTASLPDAQFEVKLDDWVRLRFGKFRQPIGLERLQPPPGMAFTEFSLATQLTPVRDVGIQLGGEAASGGAGYAVGIFNGAPDNGQNDKETASPKELAGRLFVRPLNLAGVKFDGELLLGVAGTYGKKRAAPTTAVPRGTETLPNHTSQGGNAIVPFGPASSTDQNANTIVNGVHQRLNGQLYAAVGPASLLAEYLRSEQRLSQGWIGTRVVNWGWHAIATVFIFGGKPAFGPVKIATSFDPAKGHYGALELAAKVSQLRLDGKLFTTLDATAPGKTLADPSKAVSKATELEGGLNYYYSANVRFLFDYAQTRFTGGAGTRATVANRETEHLVTGRAQLNF